MLAIAALDSYAFRVTAKAQDAIKALMKDLSELDTLSFINCIIWASKRRYVLTLPYKVLMTEKRRKLLSF